MKLTLTYKQQSATVDVPGCCPDPQLVGESKDKDTLAVLCVRCGDTLGMVTLDAIRTPAQ